MSLSEKFKSHILKTIEQFTSENFEGSEDKEPLTNREIRKILLEVQESNLEDEIRAETIHNITKLSASELDNQQDFNQTVNVLNDIECLMNKTQEVCRNVEVDVNNETVSIEEPLDFADKQNATITKVPSPVVLLNDIGRTDTFEIKNPISIDNLIPPTTVNREDFSNWKSQELRKKLENHENKLLSLYTEFMEMRMQFQKEVNRTSEPKENIKKSPILSKTPLRRMSALTGTPKSSCSARRSSSFSSVTERKKTIKPSAISTLLGTKQKFSRPLQQDKKDTKKIATNPKYANVQSTIPKPLPKRK